MGDEGSVSFRLEQLHEQISELFTTASNGLKQSEAYVDIESIKAGVNGILVSYDGSQKPFQPEIQIGDIVVRDLTGKVVFLLQKKEADDEIIGFCEDENTTGHWYSMEPIGIKALLSSDRLKWPTLEMRVVENFKNLSERVKAQVAYREILEVLNDGTDENNVTGITFKATAVLKPDIEYEDVVFEVRESPEDGVGIVYCLDFAGEGECYFTIPEAERYPFLKSVLARLRSTNPEENIKQKYFVRSITTGPVYLSDQQS